MAKAKTTTRKTTTSKAATKTSTKAAKTSKPKAGDQEVTMERRRTDRRSKAAAEKTTKQDVVEEKTETGEPKMERRAKVNRRRQIDPTTCERDYTNDEIEFMQALDAYKRSSGRMFPTCSEILEVIRGLGYSRGGNSLPEEEAVEVEATERTPAFSDEVPAIED
ncbi:hypothetical protein [Bremerella cremea]|uniref:hypothetical protein n=1 Tax=Bremerella cremea TaxID=1031537 RepID=UPI0031EF7C2D